MGRLEFHVMQLWCALCGRKTDHRITVFAGPDGQYAGEISRCLECRPDDQEQQSGVGDNDRVKPPRPVD